MAEHRAPRTYPDKGWAPDGVYRCLGFGCGWIGVPRIGSCCPVPSCGTAVPPTTVTQARWRREVYDAGRYRPPVLVEAQ